MPFGMLLYPNLEGRKLMKERFHMRQTKVVKMNYNPHA